MNQKNLLQNIFNTLKTFITNKPIDTGISSIVKDSAPITATNYKTIIDTIQDLKNKVNMPTTEFGNFGSSLQKLLESGNLAAHVSGDRLNRYKTYDSIVDNIPMVKRGLWIWTMNILSPDDITKVALKYEPSKSSKKDLSDMEIAIDQFKNINDSLKIEAMLEEIIFDTMKYGDSFVEIQIIDEEFKKVLDSKHIPIPKSSQEFTLEWIESDYKTPGTIQHKRGINVLHEEDEEEVDKPTSYPMDEILLIHRRPHNIIKLQTRKLLLGYLYVETVEDARQNIQQMRTETDMGQIINKLASEITTFLRKHQEIIIDEPYIKKDIATILQTDEKLSLAKMQIRFIPPDRIIHFRLPSSRFFPYGESWLSGLEFDARLYLTDKVATVVHRVARAGERRVVYVETGVDPDVKKYIERAKNQLIKKEIAWNESNDINAIPSAVTPFETIYIPRRNGQAFMEIETLNTGEPISDRMQTNQDLKESLANGMSVPNSLLGLPEWNEQRASITQQNITFARLIIGLQKKFTEYVTELFQKVYKFTYLNTKEFSPLFDEIIVTFNPPQNILLEYISNTYTSVSNIAQTLADFGVPKDMIAKKFMPDLPWDEIEKRNSIEKEEENQENAGY